MKTIEISKEMQKSLSILGYDTYTKVQEETIPVLMAHKNVVVKAKTGSGKTAAYALPIIEKIVWEKKYPQAIIVTCTRELAMQVKEECDLLGKYKKIKVQCILGKENIENQKALLKQQCHILVATPGRLLDLLEQGYIHLEDVETIVLDEADYMLDLGFLPSIERIMDALHSNVQIALFSATYPSAIASLVETKIPDAVSIEIKEDIKIEHYYKVCENKEKECISLLKTLDIESSLVFFDRKTEVEKMYSILKKEGIPCARIHGDLTQKVRFSQLKMFKEGEVRVLLASDVAARGIDIQKVSHVIHFGDVKNEDIYIHRSGRSGRMNEKGVSIILGNISEEIKDMFFMEEFSNYVIKDQNHIFDKVEKDNKKDHFKDVIEKIYISAGSEKKIRPQDIIGALCSIEDISKEDIGVIEVLRKMSYVEIYHHKANYIVEMMKDKTIKKKKVKVEIAK